MISQALLALRAVALVSVVAGLAFPLLLTGAAQLLFRDQANASLVELDGEPVGSALVGQAFEEDRYFHPRPSAAGVGPSGAAVSGASNLAPGDDGLVADIEERADAYRALNGLDDGREVPIDAVTASASGLDPDISVANARLQADRVARDRGRPVAEVLDLVDEQAQGRVLGLFGEPAVSVLELNLALDASEGGAR